MLLYALDCHILFSSINDSRATDGEKLNPSVLLPLVILLGRVRLQVGSSGTLQPYNLLEPNLISSPDVGLTDR